MYTESSETRQETRSSRGLLLPVALVALALFIWVGFQTTQLVRERATLKAIRTNQESAVQEAAKLRTQLDSLAAGTLELANKGNQNAKTIVAELEKRGITINPPPPAEPAKK